MSYDWSIMRAPELGTPSDYLRIACQTAARDSQDSNTQNGAVLVPKAGASFVTVANRFPVGLVLHPERLVSPLKYKYIEHAERGVIFCAAKFGIATEGATLYCPWFACADCARAIVLAGIAKVVGHATPRAMSPERWLEEIAAGDAILREGGVVTELVDCKLDATYRFNGEPLTL